ncbi:MAG: hypothetical protein IJF44_05905 [Clostridia bacterium]|nr:hypothetical protein [Clostridia bacterium]
MKKFFRAVFNIVWFIFGGLWAAVVSFALGIALCATIIGIPFGLQYFKFGRLIIMPAGKRVKLHYGKHVFVNTLWVIFGGFAAMIATVSFGIMMAATLIGIPCALQFFKVAKFVFAPFGAQIVKAR